ncbi:DUF1360 domain-containing protein [Bacillus sp. OK048]|uniref:DUF1360 domain-containing protein n=1 Tax=Bacillus sp. OK048 TaxID=1882761 RepID=UPI00088D5DC8|nr:DUF1360 domain-containing protein [Bacillus sp. OK048]SDN52943.1 Protein of unknown function [Bacillus sp. OK048]
MYSLDFIDLFIVIFASFRLTHLIVYDKITSFIRRPFFTVNIVENNLGQLEETVEIKGTGIRHFIGTLLSCFWCVGFWSSLTVVVIYIYFPVTYPFIVVLAVAGAAAVIESKI